jgi:hypothetical protein
MVNVRLGKDEFDCNALEGTYDCGCGGEDEEEDDVVGAKTGTTATKGIEVDARAGEEEDTRTTTVEPAEAVVTPLVAHP